MDHLSLWRAITEKKTSFPQLQQQIEVDTVIIGGGITGITAALALANAGKRIAILDAYQIGGITTSFSTGNLYIPIQSYYQNLISNFNIETTKLVAQSRKFAIDHIEQNVQWLDINCCFTRRPWYLYTNSAKVQFLQNEVDASKRLEIPITDVKELPYPLIFEKAAVIHDQARFNPLAYIQAIAAYLASKSCLIFENSTVLAIKEQDDRCIVKTATGKIIAKNTIIATHTPIGINKTQLLMAPYRSYVLGVYLQNAQYPDCNLWDLNEPHHAISTHAINHADPEILLIAGAHHRTGTGSHLSAFKSLEHYLQQYLPIEKIAYQWSAQHYQAADGIPYIGLASHSAKQIYIATGYFADGLVYGTLAGKIIADYILAEDNAASVIFRSNRLTFRASAKQFMEHNLKVLLHYFSDFPDFSVHPLENIKIDQAKIVQMNGEKWGVYRDQTNKLHVVSAVCTHMKCLVHWNDIERTWDCPCHGSRFNYEGTVIEGPAMHPLKKKPIIKA